MKTRKHYFILSRQASTQRNLLNLNLFFPPSWRHPRSRLSLPNPCSLYRRVQGILRSLMPTMLWIKTHQPRARIVIHQSLTTMVVKIVLLSKSTLSTDVRLAVRGRNVTINICVQIVRQTVNETHYTHNPQ